MAWLKKFIEYSREIDDYTGLCTCPAHSEFQTALIFHSAKNLKLNLKILNHIDTSNPIVPKGIEESITKEYNFEGQWPTTGYGDNSKFENDILYSPISRIYREQKWG